MSTPRFAIVASTIAEIQPVAQFLHDEGEAKSVMSYKYHSVQFDIVITGIGILPTSYVLMDYLSLHHPDGWLQAGIGGAFDGSLKQGEVYLIEDEILTGTGAEDHDGRILNPFELSWLDENDFPYESGLLVCPFIPKGISLQKAHGMTTLHAHGSATGIDRARSHAYGQIESMEGAAFFYVSLMKKIPFLSIRAISNLVEPRNKSNWQTDLAIKNLNGTITGWLQDNKILRQLTNLRNQ